MRGSWVVPLVSDVLADHAGGYPRVAAGCSKGVDAGGRAMAAESAEHMAMQAAIHELVMARPRLTHASLLQASLAGSLDAEIVDWLADRVDEMMGES